MRNYNISLIDIIEIFSIEEEKEEEPKETPKKPEEIQIRPKEKILKPIKQKRLVFSTNLLYSLHKHGLYIFLAVMISSLILISVWATFPYFQMLSKLEATLTILFIVFLLSLIIGIFYYRSFPTLEKWQITRIIREFHKKNPDRIFKNPTERTKVLAGYIQSKYSKKVDEGTQEITHYKIPEDFNTIKRFGKFTKQNIVLSIILIITILILLGLWIPVFQMHYLERWEWIANNLWVYLVTWILIPIAIVEVLLLLQKKE